MMSLSCSLVSWWWQSCKKCQTVLETQILGVKMFRKMRKFYNLKNVTNVRKLGLFIGIFTYICT